MKTVDFEISAELHKRDRRPQSILDMEHTRSEIALSLIPPGRIFKRALDIGSGLGATLIKLTHIAEDVIGLDIVNNIDSDLPFVYCDLNSKYLPFKNESFDLIICTEVLEHLHHPHQVLKEMNRILTDDGLCVISIYNAYNIIETVKVLLGKPISSLDFDSYGYQVFTSIDQNINFIETQFEIIDLEFYYIKHKYIEKFAKRFNHCSLINRLLAYTVMTLCKKRKDPK